MKACDFWSARATVASAILLGILQSGWASTTPPSEETVALAWSHGGSAVPKTVFSSKMRLVFIIGLEGAGHHYFTGAASDMFRKHPSVPLDGPMFQNAKAFYVPVIMRGSAAGFHSAMDEARSDMRALAQHAEELPPPGTFHIMKGRSFPVGYIWRSQGDAVHGSAIGC